ncbi:hypothetical protein NEOLI_003115 [Neolecta irregularis DAH-3]|uniref:Uncharacterized protein n=1 Tax=Neolecta irregularis (strain DAH-3) TaxID=1198029 RepID=A0A1U7LR29_NEOID|nr:hypothetical protein NEOLI_003115 [Neolecta irregularis DAH-3]|eukprot:OLL24971.1 hypothetical protein NEOLI_003115 [Neolecta irregularis DAH-3]
MTSPSPVSLRTWLQSAQIPKFADKGTLQDIIGQKRKSSIYPLKVGQLDAELLDEELLQLLKGQLWDALKFFRASFSSEIIVDKRGFNCGTLRDGVGYLTPDSVI